MVKPGADKLHHCISCHINMVTERNLNGKIKKMLIPSYSEVTFKLEDGSKMRVAICRDCKVKLKEKDYKQIMKNVFSGWENEVKQLTKEDKWTKQQAEEHLKQYKKKKIKKALREGKHGSNK